MDKTLTRLSNGLQGRSSGGEIITRHRGNGHKQSYRCIDFTRAKDTMGSKVVSIEYDPNRTCNISKLLRTDGSKVYILHPEGLCIGDIVTSMSFGQTGVGSCSALSDLPLGIHIHNLEFSPNRGSQISRAAGTSIKILSKNSTFAVIQFPSAKLRIFRAECKGVIGRVDNVSNYSTNSAKAGKTRWLGFRPAVRGSAMNAVDHPHGGGEGKCPIGKKTPRTPWGKIGFGVKTSNKKKISSTYTLSKNNE